MLNPLRVAIVGATGAVGKELIQCLHKRSFPLDDLHLFDSQSKMSFNNIDLAFFCIPSSRARELVPLAQRQGVLCIDGSDGFRMDPKVPLIIPEINPHMLVQHEGIIASPNCTTTLMLLPITTLHRKYKIKRIVAATYQAVSGAGAKAMEELFAQTSSILQGKKPTPQFFPHPCAFNVFPHESTIDEYGYAVEEKKMHRETQKILEDTSISVTATCVRVPVLRAHSMALNIEFVHEVTAEIARREIAESAGVTLFEDWEHNTFPMPLSASNQENIFCGRIREDHTQKNTLEMWIVGDQLLKGAALNMVQIAEALYENEGSSKQGKADLMRSAAVQRQVK